MNLQTTKEINIDFSNQKYTLINAKQYDRNSRYILVSCYNQNSFTPINNNNCFAYIRYRKADNYGVFNTCEVTKDGKVLIELTEQMLAVAGISYVDLIIHTATDISVDIVENEDGTVTIKNIDETSILSTMTFMVDVHESAFDNQEVESSYEYNALNDLLIESKRSYEEIITACRISEKNAKTSEINAKSSETKAKTSETNAKTSETNAKLSETNAAESEINAKTSEDKALISETNAKLSETNAAESEANAKLSEDASANYADWSKSYAIGGTGFRENEDVVNAQYFYEQLRRISDGTTNGLIPMGTIKFSELATAEKEVGYMYNISTNFTTDDTFREGAGNTYQAGTHVYWIGAGKWDCLVGMTVNIANVDEVKEYLGI